MSRTGAWTDLLDSGAFTLHSRAKDFVGLSGNSVNPIIIGILEYSTCDTIPFVVCRELWLRSSLNALRNEDGNGKGSM